MRITFPTLLFSFFKFSEKLILFFSNCFEKQNYMRLTVSPSLTDNIFFLICDFQKKQGTSIPSIYIYFTKTTNLNGMLVT